MWRALSGCLLPLLLASLSEGQEKRDNTILLTRMTVKPKAAPKPALKHQLLPELRQMNPGNPIQGYLKCFLEQNYLFHNKEAVERREKWNALPLKDLPLADMQSYRTNSGLRQADYAARLDTPDWQVLQKLKKDGFALNLPDVQTMRKLASALKVRIRLAIAEQRYDDALYSIQTMMALARHLGEHPTLISDLVAIASASIALDTVGELIPQPGAPNLFWALSDLPTPFIDLRKGLQGERATFAAELADLDEREPMNERQVRKVVRRLAELAKGATVGRKPLDVPQWVEKRVKDKEFVRAARQRLVTAFASADPTRFDPFPAAQVVLLDEKLTVETQRDEEMKLLNLPYWQARPLLATLSAPQRKEATPLNILLPTFRQTKLAQVRLQQRIGLLCCVEAVRIYAAEHDGKLPDKLEDVHLPLPLDPATGKPFSYKVEDKTAHLRASRLVYQLRYEVTLAP